MAEKQLAFQEGHCLLEFIFECSFFFCNLSGIYFSRNEQVRCFIIFNCRPVFPNLIWLQDSFLKNISRSLNRFLICEADEVDKKRRKNSNK